MLAEAWGRRRYVAVFVSKVDEAFGEANETRSWLDDALDCGYIDQTSLRSHGRSVGGNRRKALSDD